MYFISIHPYFNSIIRSTQFLMEYQRDFMFNSLVNEEGIDEEDMQVEEEEEEEEEDD